MKRVRAYAPGRVNLIGDHTDYSGGLVLPMAIDRGTTVDFERGGDAIVLRSEHFDEPAIVPLDGGLTAGPGPSWARYVAGVAATVRPLAGGTGTVSTTLPIGAGLSSSAALEVAVALALGFEGTSLALAQTCQAAEHLASGVPCGIMDQLVSAAGVAGHALLIDCTTLTVTPTPLPPDAEIVVVHSGSARELAATAYAQRRSAVEAAAEGVGRPLRLAEPADVEALENAVLRRRARHVVTENRRVLAFVAALAGGELGSAGEIMAESHASLRDDFEVSSPALDLLVAELTATAGVFGSRLTGAGFGGCVIALCEAGRGAALLDKYANGWIVRAAGGARLTTVT